MQFVLKSHLYCAAVVILVKVYPLSYHGNYLHITPLSCQGKGEGELRAVKEEKEEEKEMEMEEGWEKRGK